MNSANASAAKGGSVLTRMLRATAVARAAVAGLTVGLSALAVLAVVSTARTTETTAWVRSADLVTEYWSRAFLSLTLEGEALNDYLLADTDAGRDPLTSAVGSSEGTLDWLVEHGSAEDREAARSVLESYRSYTEMLAEFIGAGRGRSPSEAEAQAALVGQVASTLQKQAVAQMTRKRLGTHEYLNEVEGTTRQLRLAAVVVGIVDLLLLALCAVVLLSHQRRTERQAVRDGLTGLANRALLTSRMERALRAADRRGEQVGLLLLDLNEFKQVNDTLGHHAGDLLLQCVATRLSGAVREWDTVARLGGDEFAVLLPRIGSEQRIQEVARRTLDALQRPADLDGTVVDVRASIGAAVYPSQAVDGAELTQRADLAMYEAKRGRLGFALYRAPTPASGAAEPDRSDAASSGSSRPGHRSAPEPAMINDPR
ncbi:MAG TPA: GGDEF domain-containing protein [Actinoplanes sp.]